MAGSELGDLKEIKSRKLHVTQNTNSVYSLEAAFDHA